MGITFVTTGGNVRQLIKLVLLYLFGIFIWKPYMLASAGQPSLHGYDACMVYWTKGAHRRI